MTLLERFPVVALSLSLFSIQYPYEVFKDKEGVLNARRKKRGRIQYLYGENPLKERESWFKRLKLENVELLYIYGLGLGLYFEPLQAWLEEDKERSLIFIEDDLAVIDAFIKADLSSCFDHPQVHLHFISDPWETSLEALVDLFPSNLMAFTSLRAYRFRKKEEAMRLYLQRRTALRDVLLTETLYGHLLFKNLYPHFKKIPESFFANRLRGRFENIPAIICGAGPSLSKEIEVLTKVEDRALIFAGGSALTALTFEQVMPHIAVAIDPNPTEYDRLKEAAAFEIPLIFAPRLFAKVGGLFNGPWGYLHSGTGGSIENELVRRLQLEEASIGPDLGSEVFSVTALSISLARAMGCNPIIFTGVDLAFTDHQSYALGVVDDSLLSLSLLKKEPKAIDQLVKKRDRKGQPIYTLVKWIMEAETISRYAEEHPRTLFINSTEGGIGFSGIAYQPLQEVIERYCSRRYNLSSLLHAESQEHRWALCREEEIHTWASEIRQSLERMNTLLEEMAIPTSQGKQLLLEIDFQEEAAFKSFFQGVARAIDRLKGGLPAKREQYQRMIKSYIETFSN